MVSKSVFKALWIPSALSNGAGHHCALSYTEKNNVCVLKSFLCHWQQLPKLFLAPLLTTAYAVKKGRGLSCVRWWQLNSNCQQLYEVLNL
jgi:hypothetical protein